MGHGERIRLRRRSRTISRVHPPHGSTVLTMSRSLHMKKIVELAIDRMTFGGEAIASFQGKKVFIPWGVPGDRAKVEIVEEKKDFARGRIVELLEK